MSSYYCSNAGEIASIIDHEWGHALDDNDLVGKISSPSEAFPDIVAMLRLHDSCIGRGLQKQCNPDICNLLCGIMICPNDSKLIGYNCSQYGDCCTSCTGLRDSDYSKHLSGIAHTPGNYVCPNDYSCFFKPHIGAVPVNEAVWDLVSKDLQLDPFIYDKQSSFEIGQRLLYRNRKVFPK